MQFSLAEAQKYPEQISRSVLLLLLWLNNNIFLGLWFCLYELHAANILDNMSLQSIYDDEALRQAHKFLNNPHALI